MPNGLIHKGVLIVINENVSRVKESERSKRNKVSVSDQMILKCRKIIDLSNNQQMLKYLCLILFCCLVCSAPKLTRQTFATHLLQNHLTFVKFYSPFCGHCVAIAPEYDKLHQIAQNKYSVVEVNCQQEDDLCNQYGINSYPTLQLFLKGEALTYEGAKTASEMQIWILRFTSLSLPILSAQEAKNKIGSQKFILVSGVKEQDQRRIVLACLQSLFPLKCYMLQSSTQFIRLYFQARLDFRDYSKDQHFPQSFQRWILQTARPPVVTFSNQILSFIQKQHEYEYVAIIADHRDHFAQYAYNGFREWCESNRKAIFCVGGEVGSEQFDSLKAIIRLTENNTKITIVKSTLDIGYQFPDESVTVPQLQQFFEAAKSGRAHAIIDNDRQIRLQFKSQQILELTKSNYNSTLEQNEFVFVEYYSPRCGHCIQFAPSFKKLASYISESNSKVVIASVDASSQRQISRQQKIKGFPTFKMHISGDSIEYKLPRKAESMAQFINNITNARLLVSSSQQNLSIPHVTIAGIQRGDPLSVLSALFSDLPIYLIPGESQFKLQIHQEKIKVYEGIPRLEKVLEWLQHASAPTLVSLGEAVPCQKLQKAMNKKLPILAFFNKHDRDYGNYFLKIMKQFCLQKTDFICGYAHKDEEDFDQLIQWSKDKDPSANRIFWIETKTLQNYLLPIDPNEATILDLQNFVSSVKNGKIPQYRGVEIILGVEKPQLEEL